MTSYSLAGFTVVWGPIYLKSTFWTGQLWAGTNFVNWSSQRAVQWECFAVCTDRQWRPILLPSSLALFLLRLFSFSPIEDPVKKATVALSHASTDHVTGRAGRGLIFIYPAQNLMVKIIAPGHCTSTVHSNLPGKEPFSSAL